MWNKIKIHIIIKLQKRVNNNINENFSSTESNKVLQNIASMYNVGKLTISKKIQVI